MLLSFHCRSISTNHKSVRQVWLAGVPCVNLPASLALPAPLLAKRDVKRKCSIVSIWERLKYFVAGQDVEREDG